MNKKASNPSPPPISLKPVPPPAPPKERIMREGIMKYLGAPLYNKKTIIKCDSKCKNMIGYETVHPIDRTPLRLNMCALDRKDLLKSLSGSFLRNAKCYSVTQKGIK